MTVDPSGWPTCESNAQAALLDRLKSGSHSYLLGPPLCGKTRLLQGLKRSLESEGTLVREIDLAKANQGIPELRRHLGRMEAGVLLIDHVEQLKPTEEGAEDALDTLAEEAADGVVVCLAGRRPAGPTREWLAVSQRRTIFCEVPPRDSFKVLHAQLRDVTPRPRLLLDEVFRYSGRHPLFSRLLLSKLVELADGERIPPARVHEAVAEAYQALRPARTGLIDDLPLLRALQEEILEGRHGLGLRELLASYRTLLKEGFADLEDGHLAHWELVFLGLGQREDGEVVLPHRFLLDAFGEGWIVWAEGQAEQSYQGSEALEAVKQQVERLCSEKKGVWGRFRLTQRGSQELLPGVMYRLAVRDATSDERHWLHWFRNLGEFGKQFWDQERAVLMRLSSRKHPSLPRLVQTGRLSIDGEEVAYSLSNASIETLDSPETLARVRRHPRHAVRQLALLAEGLSLMHGLGIMHRNIWPGTVEVLDWGSEDSPFELRLSRFELSSFVANLLRRLDHRYLRKSRDQELLRVVRSQGTSALLSNSPERLRLIFEGKRGFESADADVYSLGILACHLFLPGSVEDGSADVFGEDHYDLEGLESWHQRIRGRLREAKLPGKLRDLILKMIEWSGRRMTAAEVVEAISRDYEKFFPPEESALRRYVLAYQPAKLQQKLSGLGLIRHRSDSHGRRLLRSWLLGDLNEAVITHADQTSTLATAPAGRQATQGAELRSLLLSSRVAYLCRPSPGFGEPWQVLEIVDVVQPDKLYLPPNTLERSMPRFDLLPLDQLGEESFEERPSWRHLFESIERVPLPPEHLIFYQALDWFLLLQEALLASAVYPVRARYDKATENWVLEHDNDRDIRRFDRNDLLHLLVARHREKFGEHFRKDSEEKFGKGIRVYHDNNGLIGNSVKRARGRFREVLSPREIRVDFGDHRIPTRAWVQSEGNLAHGFQIEAQRDARESLFELPGLLDQIMVEPAVISESEVLSREVDAKIEGEARSIIKRMVEVWPFFAVQGPPGTGKTTVVSHAVELQLSEDPSQRILVTAQSHRALDNLAERILDQLRERRGDEASKLIEVRILSKNVEPERVSPGIRELLPDERTRRLVQSIESRCEELLRAGAAERSGILKKWRNLAEKQHDELRSRILRSANLVFCTSGMATDRHLGSQTFDWVVVEEAAKAWPTELAIPLARTQRWTLVGDPLQLKAFGRDDVERVLEDCARSVRSPELRRHGERKQQYLRCFDFFYHLFYEEQVAEDGSKTEVSRTGDKDSPSPVQSLMLQFRMRKSIADLVSSVFYQYQLETAEKARHRPVPLDSLPGWLPKSSVAEDQSLAWIDSSKCQGKDEKKFPRWQNLLEVDLVAAVVSDLGLGSGRASSVAILTPYRKQVDRLKEHPKLGGYKERIFTVDNFQGQEADIVVVSLVRSNKESSRKGSSRDKRYGFLASPERANVLLSRARTLLVIVGCFDHFDRDEYDEDKERTEARRPFWKEVCRYMEDVRVPAEREFPGEAKALTLGKGSGASE